jgi:hypothetical protein
MFLFGNINVFEMLQLPSIITLESFNGNFDSFYSAVYAIFFKDFVKSRPTFQGTKLRLKSHPFIDGKEYTFYHFTHDGDIEKERLPNLRRMERIPWPRPIIDNSISSELKVWRNTRGRNNRILIYYDKFDYLIVLEDRGDYILPWTAYLVDYKNQKEKLLTEYNAYKKTETAQ